MLPQLSLFQQCSIQSQDVMQTWLHWRCQDAQLVQKHFLALFHPKPNECLHFDLESCNLMCTYTVVTHPCHIPLLAQARPMLLCIYTIVIYYYYISAVRTSFRKCKLNSFNPKHCARRSVRAEYRREHMVKEYGNRILGVLLESIRVLLLCSNPEFYLQRFRLQVVLKDGCSQQP